MANILIVEDDAHMMRILSMWLQRNGHKVTEANNGLSAQRQLASGAFEIMVSDVNMPEVNGLELVQWLRDELGSDLPVILLSSRSDQGALAAKLKPLGVTVFPKPFSPSQLISTIESRLNESGQERTGASVAGK